jgi:hypothetical protein
MVEVAPEPEPEAAGPVARRWSPALAIAAALLLGLGIIGAAVIPARHLFFSQSKRDKKGEIGVPVGVSQPAPVWEGKPLVMNKDRMSGSPSPPAATTVAHETAATEPAGSIPAPNASAPPVIAQASPPEPPAPAAGPQSVWETAGNRPLSERVVSKGSVASAKTAEAPDESKSEPSEESQAKTDDRIGSQANDRDQDVEADTQKRVTNSEDARPRLRPRSPLTAHRTSRTMVGHGSVARIASDGSVILRLPNGEIAVLPPPRDEYRTRRYHRRAVIQRRTVYPPDYPYGSSD